MTAQSLNSHKLIRVGLLICSFMASCHGMLKEEVKQNTSKVGPSPDCYFYFATATGPYAMDYDAIKTSETLGDSLKNYDTANPNYQGSSLENTIPLHYVTHQELSDVHPLMTMIANNRSKEVSTNHLKREEKYDFEKICNIVKTSLALNVTKLLSISQDCLIERLNKKKLEFAGDPSLLSPFVKNINKKSKMEEDLCILIGSELLKNNPALKKELKESCFTELTDAKDRQAIRLCLTPDNQLVATIAADKKIHLYDLEGKQIYQSNEALPDIDKLEVKYFLHNGPYLIASSPSSLFILDLIFKQLQTIDQGSTKIGSFAFNPAGTILAVANVDKTIRLFDTGTWKCRSTLPTKSEGAETSSGVLAFDPSGKLLSISSDRGAIFVWNTVTQHCEHTLTGHNGPIRYCFISKGGNEVVSVGSDKKIRQWNLVTKKNKEIDLNNHEAIACNETGTIFVTLNKATKKFAYRDITTDILKEFDGYLDAGRDLFTLLNYVENEENCSLFASYSPKSIGFWDGQAKSRGNLQNLKNFNCFCLSNDGKLVISSDTDNTLRLWYLLDKEFENYLDNKISLETVLLLLCLENKLPCIHHLKKIYNKLDRRIKPYIAAKYNLPWTLA